MKKNILKCFLIALISTNAFAGQFVTISNFKLWATTYGDDAIRITDATVVNPSSCSDPDSYFVLKTLTTQEKNRIYSTLLAAVSANKPVEIWVDGCEGNRPAIKDIRIQ